MTGPNKDMTIGGRTLRLRFSMKAFAALEEHYQCSSIEEVGQRLQDSANLKSRDIAVIVWAATRSHHPELTQEEVFDILDEVDDVSRIAELLNGVIAAGQPQDVDDDKNPQTAESASP